MSSFGLILMVRLRLQSHPLLHGILSNATSLTVTAVTIAWYDYFLTLNDEVRFLLIAS